MSFPGAPPTSAPSSSSSHPPPPPPPKILLAKPSPPVAAPSPSSSSSSTSASRTAAHAGSLNLLSDSWDLLPDRVLPYLTENTDFTVIGVIGPPGVGKSTIMNALYGADGSSPVAGMLPSFATQTDETRAMAKHCTTGIELRISAERLILLDTQPVFSPSILVDMVRPDGLSTIPVLNGEPLSADLAHELMGIQIGVFLASVCNVVLVVSEGIHDFNMWNLMLTVDLLKHMIPDPSLVISIPPQVSNPGSDREVKSNESATREEYLAALVFVHTKLREKEFSPSNIVMLRKALMQNMGSSFNISKFGKLLKTQIGSSNALKKNSVDSDSVGAELFLLPLSTQDGTKKDQFESYSSMLGKLHDQVLSMTGQTFAKTVSERDWLRNSAKIWELVKKSPTIADYCRTLQNSGLFRSAQRQGVDPTGPLDKRKERHRVGHI